MGVTRTRVIKTQYDEIATIQSYLISNNKLAVELLSHVEP